LHDVEHARERIVPHRPGRTAKGAEIPMIVADEVVEFEGVG